MVKTRTAVIYHVRARIFDNSRAVSALNGFKTSRTISSHNAFFFLKRVD